jgi:hypothetical protein
MPLLALVPKQVWVAIAAGLGVIVIAVTLIHYGETRQQSIDAVVAAKTVQKEMEVRRDAERNVAADPDPVRRLREEWRR